MSYRFNEAFDYTGMCKPEKELFRAMVVKLLGYCADCEPETGRNIVEALLEMNYLEEI